MTGLIYILAYILIGFLMLAGLYQLTLAIASRFKAKCICEFDGEARRLLVLVPSYREDAVIINSTKINMSLKYQYPSARFDYVVISDGLQPDTNKGLTQLGAEVLEVNFEKSTKVKALQAAMRKYDGNYDGVVILDADNTVDTNFLYKASHYLSCGHKAIQGLRKAANTQTNIALMDGLSEAANTAMLCAGANRLGLSSKLSGSVMVFDYQLFKSLVFCLEAVGGFDKELELAITERNIFIKYAHDLVAYDEKVSDNRSFARQRGRWLQAQYSFLFQSIYPGVKSLMAGNRDHFHKAIQLALPPRVLSPFILAIGLMSSIIAGSTELTILSSIGLLATAGAYLMVLPLPSLVKSVWTIIRTMPSLVISTCKALTLMKASKRTFLHTPHGLTKAHV
ncbi:hypothetical protein BFP97_05010 [Roseivirga sp. 4D4]|uniref:glycosyltransferase n=1 Tax=Roseivirga sp. 4D4 TaxID=1889784 RepID=UPI00085318CA|nr:glycosyltransferase family 2 protein [Roseivirga sp. 4D4]OEK00908.1 hypothetical protein BFP97_05010 [Roseivirga sp. 4D4]